MHSKLSPHTLTLVLVHCFSPWFVLVGFLNTWLLTWLGELPAHMLAPDLHPSPVQVAMEETPEHPSFSLWDLNTLAGGAPGQGPSPQAQQLAARAQQGVVRQHSPPGASGVAATPDGFGGFASRYGRGSVPPAATVLDLAGAAADRLLQAQRVSSAGGACSPSESLLGSLAVGSDAETAKEARLTLLRAWVNAAAGSAGGLSRSADGSSFQQQDGVSSLGSPTFEDGAVGRVGRVGGRGLAVVAQDMASVLAPAELLLIVQQLQVRLQS